jgi:hypothetical protein
MSAVSNLNLPALNVGLPTELVANFAMNADLS